METIPRQHATEEQVRVIAGPVTLEGELRVLDDTVGERTESMFEQELAEMRIRNDERKRIKAAATEEPWIWEHSEWHE